MHKVSPNLVPIQSSPWMDPIHVQLWCRTGHVIGLLYVRQTNLLAFCRQCTALRHAIRLLRFWLHGFCYFWHRSPLFPGFSSANAVLCMPIHGAWREKSASLQN